MLSLFARINAVNISDKKPVFLLLDEAELALHPQWQKDFVYHFTDFINTRFSEQSVQVVLTAHSPFILSDMPSNSVILLKRVGDNTTVIENLDTRFETFGANIHELYADSFFLEDALMGKFAKEKIDDIIKKLTSAEPLSDSSGIHKLIGIIGDPIIRTKLAEMLAIKLGKNGELARLRAQQELINFRISQISRKGDTN